MTRAACERDPHLLLVLVDGMRWDYIARTTFLRSRGGRAAVGRFQEPYGFTPRAAYFRGLDVEPGGYTHMFAWNPATSPFAAARALAAAASTPFEAHARAAVVERARELLPPFAAAYVSTAAIPFPFLPSFDVAERTAPWHPCAPPDSLFQRLSAAGLPWFAYAWPDTGGASDAAVVAAALEGIRAGHRFAFVHLSDLDAAGHAFGPGAPETQRALANADRLVQALVEHCERIWPAVRLIVFGDHGMVRVVRTADVLRPLEESRISFGRDAGYFVESTGIRFWYFTPAARQAVHELFDDADYGRFLGPDDAARFGLDACGRANGDEHFLADPGVVFCPSFFGTTPPLGMHGYDPACRDNQGAFLYWSPDDDRPRDAGVVRAARLFATALHACGLPVPAGAPPPIALERCPVRTDGWTASRVPAHEALVEADMARIHEGIRRAVPDCEAIVVGGSFGRGEGVVRDAPAVQAVNDYDVLVIGGTPRTDVDLLRRGLHAECRAEAVDVSHVAAGRSVAASQLAYDLRHGSTVLYGAPAVLDDWGCQAPGELTLEDAWLGVFNRVIGVLDAFDPADQACRCARVRGQILKLAVALGDAFLIAWGDYHHEAAARRERVAVLSRAAGLPAAVRCLMDAAYRDKLFGPCDEGSTWNAESLQCLRLGIEQFARSSPGTAEPPAGAWIARAAAQAARGRLRQADRPAHERNSVPSSPDGDAAAIYEAAWPLFVQLPAPEAPAAWHQRRAALVAAWLKLIHP